LKTYKKNKYLQHSPYFLNQIVKKEVNDDTEYGYTPTKFIKSYCTGNITLSKGNTVASYTGSSYNWNGVALCSASRRWSIKLVSSCTYLMIGMLTKDYNSNGSNYSSQGYFFFMSQMDIYIIKGKVAILLHLLDHLMEQYMNLILIKLKKKLLFIKMVQNLEFHLKILILLNNCIPHLNFMIRIAQLK